jgi:uncharacterized protein
MLHTMLLFTVVVGIVSLAAGFFGALTGLGGGVIIVPALTLAFGVNIRYAMGASLISVIATSSGAAASYLREGFPNIRIGMFLEVATTIGAITGAFVTGMVSPNLVAVIFGLLLLGSTVQSVVAPPTSEPASRPDPLARRFRLTGTYPTPIGTRTYAAKRVAAGFGIMYVAGMLSGLLGVGSGAVKVLGMDRAMQLPFKVSTTTSNFMIGVTAAASAGLYLRRGFIDPALTFPVMLGILLGATLGSRVLVAAQVTALRRIFTAVVALLAIEILYKGFTHAF